QRALDGEEDDGDEAGAEVLAQIDEDLLAGRRAEHEVEHDDVRSPVDGSPVRGVAVADGDAFETRPLENALDELEHLLVVVDHHDQLTAGFRDHHRGGTPGSRPSDCGHDAGPASRRRGSFSDRAMALSAARRISAISALTASGSSVSAAINSQ